MNTNDPTTGELIEFLRSEPLIAHRQCADRLEIQERELLQKKEELEEMQEAETVLHAANEVHWTYIKELTARAESAEAREKAAIADLTEHCECTYCFYKESNKSGVICYPCFGSGGHSNNFKWRGLPQEGARK